MKSRILRNYTALAQSQLYIKAGHIATSIQKNAVSFPSPAPALEYASQLLQEFGDSLKAAQSRDKGAVTQKNGKYDLVIELLDKWSLYVANQAQGNADILASSGFDITVSKGRAKKEGLSVTTGIPGEIIVMAEAVRGAKSYVHQYTTDPLSNTSDWEQVTTTSRKHKHTGLTSGVKYWFRVIAVGTRGQQTYSEPVARIAQ